MEKISYAERFSQITETLYLGPEFVTRRDYRSLMKQVRLQAVLNVSVRATPEWENRRILYMKLNMNDLYDPLPVEYLLPGLLFLRSCQEQGYPTLVHCSAGMSRSPTLVVLYFMTLGSSYSEALRRVRDKRHKDCCRNLFLLNDANVFAVLDYFRQPRALWDRVIDPADEAFQRRVRDAVQTLEIQNR